MTNLSTNGAVRQQWNYLAPLSQVDFMAWWSWSPEFESCLSCVVFCLLCEIKSEDNASQKKAHSLTGTRIQDLCHIDDSHFLPIAQAIKPDSQSIIK